MRAREQWFDGAVREGVTALRILASHDFWRAFYHHWRLICTGQRRHLAEALQRERTETQARALGLTDVQVRDEIDWWVTRYRERGLPVDWAQVRRALWR